MGARARTADRIDSELAAMTHRRRCAHRADLEKRLGRRALERAVRDGALVRLLPGVYAPRAIAERHAVRCHAVWLATGGRAVIGGRSALHLYDEDFPAPARVEVVLPHGSRAPRAPWIAVRRRAPSSGTVARAGAHVLPREEAVVDAWARAAPRDRKALLYDALWYRIATARQVVRAASRISRVPDRRRLDGILGDFLDGATSPTEVMAKREVFRHRRFGEFERQVAMRVAGRDRTLDMLHRRARLVVELDGDRYHRDRDAQVRDDERGAELMSEGYAPIRFRYRDLRDRPEWCRAMVDRALAHRLAALP